MGVFDKVGKILEETRERILANMEREHVNASGRTSRAIVVRQVQGGWQLVRGDGERAEIDAGWRGTFSAGVAPIRTLERGRAGGRVPRGFYYIIQQWTRDKGLAFGSETERDTFAYFVARKIAREGTERNKNNINIYSDEARRAAADIKDALSVYIKDIVLHKSIE